MARDIGLFDIDLPDTGIYGKSLKKLEYRSVRAFSPEQALAAILRLNNASHVYRELLPDIRQIVTEVASQQRMF